MANVWQQEELRVHKLFPNQEAKKAKWKWLKFSLLSHPLPCDALPNSSQTVYQLGVKYSNI